MTTKNKQIQRLPAFIIIIGILACLVLGFLGYKAATHKEAPASTAYTERAL